MMHNDPVTNAFLKILNEDNEIKGTSSVWDASRGEPKEKTTFKGNYGGGNPYRQIDPDLEFQNLTKEVLGSEMEGLDEMPGSVMANDEKEPGESSEPAMELDTGNGADVKQGRVFGAPDGFTKITDGLPKSKEIPGKMKEMGELGESVIDEEFNVCPKCGTSLIPGGSHGFMQCDGAMYPDASEPQACEEEFMAGAHCNLPAGHEGPHSSGEEFVDDSEEFYDDQDHPVLRGPFGMVERFTALPDDIIEEAISERLNRWDIAGDSEPLRRSLLDPSASEGGLMNAPSDPSTPEGVPSEMGDMGEDDVVQVSNDPSRYKISCPIHRGLGFNGDCKHCEYLSNGPNNPRLSEDGGLYDAAIAEMLGKVSESPISATLPVGGVGLSDLCANCHADCQTTCDICGEFVCSSCEPQHNYAAHESASPDEFSVERDPETPPMVQCAHCGVQTEAKWVSANRASHVCKACRCS